MSATKTKKAPAPKTFTVSDIAGDANKKVIRAKLRRMYAGENAATLPKPVSETRWEFANKDRAKVRKLVA